MNAKMFAAPLTIPPEVMRIARRLEDAGFETWCVGGAVRDALLQIENNDVDLATAAPPDAVRALFRRTVPIGIRHGTVAVLDSHNNAHEVTTFRRDVRTDGRHAEVEFGVTLEDDLARRDFTINAIAYHPIKREWSDPQGGFHDLEVGVLRAVGDPDNRFREDYLRILRCARFTARFNFRIEGDTLRAAREHARGLSYLSPERVRDEWFKSLSTAKSVPHLCELWHQLGADGLWLPGIDCGLVETVRRAKALQRLDARDPVFMTIYLSSDAGQTLERLRCSGDEIERGKRVDRARDLAFDPADQVNVRRWMADVGSAVDDIVTIARIDGRPEGLDEAVAKVRASGAPLTIADLAVNGADLKSVGVPEGPEMGIMLARLREFVLEHPDRNQRDELLRIASRERGHG